MLEQSQTRTWLKGLVRAWCRAVAWLLDLRSYLLGDEQQNAHTIPQPAPDHVPQAPGAVGGGLGAAHQALLQRDTPSGFQPYERPQWFAARLVGLLICVCATLVIASLIALTLPVWLGRKVTAFCLPQPAAYPTTQTDVPRKGVEMRVHELYTAAAGTYLCWLMARAAALALSWLPQGRAAILSRLKQWFMLGARAAAAFIILLGLVPLLFGLLLELVSLIILV